MDDAASHPTSADHAAHDQLLVAEAADRGGRLPSSLATCPDCRALHADLIAIAAAVPVAAMPTRPRDYRLTEADAARLRPAGWRRWLAAIGTSRDVVTRPLALGLTTLGLAGLLVATVPGALPAGGTAGAAPAAGDAARQSDPSAAASAETVLGALPAGAPSAAPVAPSSETMDVAATAEQEKAESDGVFTGGDAPSAAAGADSGGSTDQRNALGSVVDERRAAPAVPVLAVIAGGMLVSGLALFGLRRRARRV